MPEQTQPSPGSMKPTVVDGGDMDCGSGLLLMIRNAFDPLPPGSLVEIRSREISVGEDLPAWCRMVGHELLSTSQAPNRYTHFLVRKKSVGGGADKELDEHLAKARAYEWRVRAKITQGMDSRVFSRNHAIDVGQPASFNTEDNHPGSVELLLGALASCLASGFQWRLTQRKVEVFNLEITLSAKPENILVFLGIENEGSPGFAEISGRVFVDADTAEGVGDEVIEAIWQDTLKRSPVAQTLARGIKLNLQLSRVR